MKSEALATVKGSGTGATWFVELFAGSGHVSHIAQRILQLPAQRCIRVDIDPGA